MAEHRLRFREVLDLIPRTKKEKRKEKEIKMNLRETLGCSEWGRSGQLGVSRKRGLGVGKSR